MTGQVRYEVAWLKGKAGLDCGGSCEKLEVPRLSVTEAGQKWTDDYTSR